MCGGWKHVVDALCALTWGERSTQPRVSDLLRGRLDLFSTDTLSDMLARLGVHVRFVLKTSRRRLKVA